jgi:hypothetical protein
VHFLKATQINEVNAQQARPFARMKNHLPDSKQRKRREVWAEAPVAQILSRRNLRRDLENN